MELGSLDVDQSSIGTSTETGLISQSIKAFSLYGERVYINSNKLENYSSLSMKSFSEKYKIINKIYSNFSAPSHILLLEDAEGLKYAAKETIKKRLTGDYYHEFVKNEMVIQHSLSRFSRNIVKVLDYYEDEDTYLMVMEYSYQPNYFEDLLENQYQAISEEGILRLYAYDILSAIKLVHDNGIIHCDIKPQNFLIFQSTEEDNADLNDSLADDQDTIDKIKLTDFGLAHIINEKTNKAYMKYRAGTMEYKAPEVKNDSYVDKSIDIWSFGITLYKMAVAYFPTAYNRYQYGSWPIPFRKTDWKDFEGKELIQDLISKCVVMEPSARITVEEALDHPWFKI